MKAEGRDSCSVLRGPFDQWLASKAEGAGAEAIYGIAVEGLVKDGDGTVIGVRAGEDEITAEVVALCGGVNFSPLGPWVPIVRLRMALPSA